MVIFEIYVCCQLNIALCKLKLCLQASSLLLHAPSSSVAQRTTIVTPRYRSSFKLRFDIFPFFSLGPQLRHQGVNPFLFLHFLFFSAAAFLLRLPLHMVEYHPGTFSTLKPVRIILIIFINNQSAT